MWGYPLWLFLGPWIVVAVSSRIDRAALMRVAAVWGAVCGRYVLSFIVQYAVLPCYDHRYRAVLFPGRKSPAISRCATGPRPARRSRTWSATMWLGGNIDHYAPEHRATLIDGNPQRAPWIDLKDLAARGGVVAWTVGDLNVVPERYAAVAGKAVVQPPFSAPFRRGNGEVTVGWAIIPPAGAKP